MWPLSANTIIIITVYIPTGCYVQIKVYFSRAVIKDAINIPSFMLINKFTGKSLL